MKIGLSYAESYSLPFGELLDLINIEQVKSGEVTLKEAEEEDIWEILKME